MIDFIINIFGNLINNLNSSTIFILMAIESSFIPFPSEIIMIPAGYLAAQGKLNIYFIIIFGVFGSLVGATINYCIGKYLGRKYLLKHNRIFFINKKHLEKSEDLFKNYGSIATFLGRLIPAIRQYISIPAGFTNMNFIKFLFYSFLGAFIWTSFLAVLGYYVGINFSLKIIKYYNFLVLLFIILVLIFIIYLYKRKNK